MGELRCMTRLLIEKDFQLLTVPDLSGCQDRRLNNRINKFKDKSLSFCSVFRIVKLKYRNALHAYDF